MRVIKKWLHAFSSCVRRAIYYQLFQYFFLYAIMEMFKFYIKEINDV